jgi:hypothetical protein
VSEEKTQEAKADQLIEHKRDIEKELRSNQADDGVNGSKMRGIGRWIYDGAAVLTLQRKLAEAEADLDWLEQHPSNIICLGDSWEYRVGGKGTRHDPWRWSNKRMALRDAIHEARDGGKA